MPGEKNISRDRVTDDLAEQKYSVSHLLLPLAPYRVLAWQQQPLWGHNVAISKEV